ncbi:MAG: hypothetical protein AAF264_14220 [Pseudomonadota bacterium]
MLHLPGKTVMEKVRSLERQEDDNRTPMLPEPHGTPDIRCNVPVPPRDPIALLEAGIVEMMER